MRVPNVLHGEREAEPIQLSPLLAMDLLLGDPWMTLSQSDPWKAKEHPEI